MFNKDNDFALIEKMVGYLVQIIQLIMKLFGLGGDDAEKASK